MTDERNGQQRHKTILSVPDSYIQKIENYTIADAAMAMGLYFLFCIAMALSGLLAPYVSGLAITAIGGAVNLGFVLLVLGLLKLRRQGLETIGLKKGNLKLSLIMGGIFSAILFFCNCLSHLLFEGQRLVPLVKILMNFLYFFTVALAEETIFRGYLETRLYGLIRNVYVVAALTGLLFVLMHFPFRMIAYRKSFWDLAGNIPYMFDLFVTHLILSFICIRSDSLYGAVLPHWVSNLSYAIVARL